MTPFQRSICQALRELSDSGTAIFLMHGNRDFMLGQAFCKAAGCTLLKDPSVVQLQGEPVLLMHGDSLCTRDEGYMKLRRCLRNTGIGRALCRGRVCKYVTISVVRVSIKKKKK